MFRKLALTILTLIMLPSVARTQPALSIPLNGSFVETTTPALLWVKLDNANVYVVSVFTDRKGVRRILKLTVRGNSCLVPEGRLEQGKKYWWNVAPSRGGILDEPSLLWSFTVLKEDAPKRELPEEDYQPQIFKTEPGGKTGNKNGRVRNSSSTDVREEGPAARKRKPAARPIRLNAK